MRMLCAVCLREGLKQERRCPWCTHLTVSQFPLSTGGPPQRGALLSSQLELSLGPSQRRRLPPSARGGRARGARRRGGSMEGARRQRAPCPWPAAWLGARLQVSV